MPRRILARRAGLSLAPRRDQGTCGCLRHSPAASRLEALRPDRVSRWALDCRRIRPFPARPDMRRRRRRETGRRVSRAKRGDRRVWDGGAVHGSIWANLIWHQHRQYGSNRQGSGSAGTTARMAMRGAASYRGCCHQPVEIDSDADFVFRLSQSRRALHIRAARRPPAPGEAVPLPSIATGPPVHDRGGYQCRPGEPLSRVAQPSGQPMT